MSEAESQKATMKYLKQICIAVAVLLILYGFLHLLNFLSDFTNVAVSYYLWIFFQIVVAFLIIFIGLRVYSVARTIRQTSLSQLWHKARAHLLVLLIGCITLLPITLYPLPASNLSLTKPFQPYSAHTPISFSYRLDHGWNFQSGGSIYMYTTQIYRTTPYRILIDVIPTIKGWIVIPYKIDGSNAILQSLGPARAEINLGMIGNGDYAFKVVMSNAIDLFQIHRTDNKFWVEETRTSMGSVVQKIEFEKRLDGFTMGYGWAESNEIRLYALDLIKETGAEVIDTNIPEYPNPISVRFYFNGTFDKLSNIILDLAKQHPNSSISIHGNDKHYESTYAYVGTVFVLPERADDIRSLITRYGLTIYSEGIYRTYSTEQRKYIEFIEIHVSSAPLERPFSAIKSEIIERIQNELGLKFGFNNHFLVSP